VHLGRPGPGVFDFSGLAGAPTNATALSGVRDGIQAAAAAVPGVVYVETLTVPMFGQNIATYVQGNATHPTQAGANYLGYKLASRISAALAGIG
jgi:hypothetical protein